jgi:murein DD-endopeptidase MepM/ murein hydrolase activator NlpD
LVGLTAALAAAAGTTAFSLSQSSAPITASANSSQPGAITTARINRRQQGSRDSSRLALTLEATRKKQADLAATQTLSERRALALQAAKAAAVAKANAAAAAERNRKRVAAQVVLPVSGYQLTARFGQGGSRWASFHTGLDFAAPIGTPIHSVMAGKVIFAAFAGAYGRQVQVRLADGTVTSYSHMSEFTVSVGDVVPVGGQVGAIGVTGNTTGPHVHFEVRPHDGAPIDPEPWLREHGLTP